MAKEKMEVWEYVGMESVTKGSAVVVASMIGIADKEERDDLIRRQLAIMVQVGRYYGKSPTKSFEDHVKETIAETDRLRAEGLALGIVQEDK